MNHLRTMKKALAALLLALLALSCAGASAATFSDVGLSFEYDDELFFIGSGEGDAHEKVISLGAKDFALGETYIIFHLSDLGESEPLPTLEDFAESGLEAMQGEWNSFADVIMYTANDERVFVVPVDDGHLMTVAVHACTIDDEALAMARDDAISAVLDSMAYVPPAEDEGEETTDTSED